MNQRFKNAILLEWADNSGGYVPYIYDNGTVTAVPCHICRTRDSAIRFGQQAALARQNLFGKVFELFVREKDTAQPTKIDVGSV